MRHCDFCRLPEQSGGRKMRYCIRCRCGTYCSHGCHRAHWPSHKQACGLTVRAIQKAVKKALEQHQCEEEQESELVGAGWTEQEQQTLQQVIPEERSIRSSFMEGVADGMRIRQEDKIRSRFMGADWLLASSAQSTQPQRAEDDGRRPTERTESSEDGLADFQKPQRRSLSPLNWLL